MIRRIFIINNRFHQRSVHQCFNKQTILSRYHTTPRHHLFNFFKSSKQEQTSSSLIDYQNQVEVAANEGNIERVKDLLFKYSQILDKNSKQALYWRLFKERTLASLSYQQLDYPSAIQHCDNALQLEADLVKSQMFDDCFVMYSYVVGLKCEILTEQMDYEQALTSLTDLIDRMRKRISEEKSESKLKMLYDMLSLHLYRRARVLMIVYRVHEALLDVDESISLNSQAYNLLLKAEIHFRKYEIPEAVSTAQKVLQLNSDHQSNINAMKIVAKSMAAKQRYEEAIETCDTILQTEHLDAFTYILRAECNSSLHRYEQVVDDCKKAENADPSQIFNILEVHANALNRLARYNELVEHIEHLHRIIKDLDVPTDLVQSTNLLKQVAIIDQLCWNGEYKEALDILQKDIPEIEKDTKDYMHTNILSRKADVLLLCNRNEEGLQAADEYVKYGGKTWSEHADSLELRALAYAKLGKLEDAYIDLKAAEEQINNTEEANVNLKEEITANQKYTRAQIFSLDHTKKKESVQLFLDALEYSTRNQLHDMRMPILADLARVERELGMIEDAKRHLAEVLKYSPNHKVYSQVVLS